MEEFLEIIERMIVNKDKLPGGQKFRIDFIDLFVKDLTGELEGLTGEEIDELFDEVFKDVKGIDYQFVAAFSLLTEKVFNEGDLSALPEVFRLLNEVPTSYGGGLYWKQFIEATKDLIDFFLGSCPAAQIEAIVFGDTQESFPLAIQEASDALTSLNDEESELSDYITDQSDYWDSNSEGILNTTLNTFYLKPVGETSLSITYDIEKEEDLLPADFSIGGEPLINALFIFDDSECEFFGTGTRYVLLGIGSSGDLVFVEPQPQQVG